MDTRPQLRIATADTVYANPLENWKRYQAQSILVGIETQDSKAADPPTLQQAEDILSWAAKARAYEPPSSAAVRLVRFVDDYMRVLKRVNNDPEYVDELRNELKRGYHDH